MKHTTQLERAPQTAARKRQALIVRTGVRAGAEEAIPAPTVSTVATAPSAPEAADTITIKLADLVKMMQCFGGSA